MSPLTDEQTAQLIGRVLGRSVLAGDTQQMLLERAGGNPLYAEQFAELFVERGSTDELPLPETLQGIIAARLDGLGPDEKGLLQDAAVVGKVFWAGALGRDERDVDRDASTRSSARASSDDSGVRPSKARASSPSRTHSSATSPTGRSRVPTARRSIVASPSGSSRSVDPRITPRCWRTTGVSALDLARASGNDDAELIDRARLRPPRRRRSSVRPERVHGRCDATTGAR